ncbi:MAG: hypothetical protein C3F13_02925 [Anaerolineales bacterium]|nr:MAG: hypothetical protein C3F13_02925 [Anaerolineales bacterium]
MILPTKHLQGDRALLTVGAGILAIIDEPKTISRIWAEFSRQNKANGSTVPVTFDWFVLALDLLFSINTITYGQGYISKAKI